MTLCVWLLKHYITVRGHPRSDTSLIPDQLFEKTHLLETNICGSSPVFEGKYRTSAPSCSSFPSLLLIPDPLSDVCFLPRRHLLRIISDILTLIHRGRQRRKENKFPTLFASGSFFVARMFLTLMEHVFHIARLNFQPFDSSQPACRCSASHLLEKENGKLDNFQI